MDEELQRQWQEFRSELNLLDHLRIPRWFGTHTASRWVLHGFSDTSEKAYATTVYLVLQNKRAALRSTFITGKSKVAPIKTISRPRLELYAAFLLCRLMCRVRDDLQRQTSSIFCWTNSEIVLAWIKGRPNNWNTFVANRTSEILTSLPEAHWGHVPPASNPAPGYAWLDSNAAD